MGGTDEAGLLAGAAVPGPHQIKLRVPRGARAVHLSAQFTTSPLASPPTLQLLVKANAPITFTHLGTGLTNNADQIATATVANNLVSATVPIDVPCLPTSAVYLSLANVGASAVTVRAVLATTDPAAGCGDSTFDAGSPIVLPLATAEAAPTGCGCSTGSPEALALGALGALAWLKRRKVRSLTPLPTAEL